MMVADYIGCMIQLPLENAVAREWGDTTMTSEGLAAAPLKAPGGAAHGYTGGAQSKEGHWHRHLQPMVVELSQNGEHRMVLPNDVADARISRNPTPCWSAR
jgi:hypothetical protein